MAKSALKAYLGRLFDLRTLFQIRHLPTFNLFLFALIGVTGIVLYVQDNTRQDMLLLACGGFAMVTLYSINLRNRR